MDFLELLILIVLAPLLALVLVTLRAIFVMPLVGALVRFRANYTPRGVGLDEEDARVGPVVNSLWAMMIRVKNLEGWDGMYKGVIPYTCLHTLTTSLVFIFLGATVSILPSGTLAVPDPSGIQMGFVTVFLALITVPGTILINRAITTPYQLPYREKRSLQQSLQLLLTPYEYRKPWILWLTPGLLAITAIYVGWTVLLMRIMRNAIVGEAWSNANRGASDEQDEQLFANVSTFRLIVFFLFQGLSAIILTPLEVMTTRLSLQRNRDPSDPSATEEISGEVPFIAEGEDVVGYRDAGEAPYVGMIDCTRKMLEEEGWGAFMRGWWITLGTNLIRGFP
ncbi:Mitochondrial substrate/solute carrier [Phaffia rhodozyma]|uniref:Mitochondrial substrate/solute carrier n=1 Tax=Phaffia rhodozyma TaxID=264483 RepID=A0A0F7SNZ7_PHARH|nr:Mitochondrial substrate/solute carrier [Phaffia rhodozyma]